MMPDPGPTPMPDPGPTPMPDPGPTPMPVPEAAFMETGTFAVVENPTTGVHPYSYNDWGFWAMDDQGETLMKAVLKTPEAPVDDTESPYSVFDSNARYGDPVPAPTSGSGTWIGKVRAAGFTQGWVPVEGDAHFTIEFPEPGGVTIIGGSIPVSASFTALRAVDGQTTYADIQWLGGLRTSDMILMSGAVDLLIGEFFGDEYLLGGGFQTQNLVGHFAAERQ